MMEPTIWSKQDRELMDRRLRNARQDARVDPEVNLVLPQLIDIENLIIDLTLHVEDGSAKEPVGIELLPSPLTFEKGGHMYKARPFITVHPCMARMVNSCLNEKRWASLEVERMHGETRTGLCYLRANNVDKSARPLLQIMIYPQIMDWITETVEREWELWAATAELTHSE